VLRLRPAPEFEVWLEKMGVTGADGRLLPIGGGNTLLDYARRTD
jgi:ethanolamine ammonia-lyase large subunit